MLIRRLFRCWSCSRTVWMIFSCMILFLFLSSVLAQEATDDTTADQPAVEGTATDQSSETQPTIIQPLTQPTAQKTSWLGFLLKGGLTMIPIVLCSIGFTQEFQYATLTISEDLKQDANACIRSHSTHVTINSFSNIEIFN